MNQLRIFLKVFLISTLIGCLAIIPPQLLKTNTENIDYNNKQFAEDAIILTDQTLQTAIEKLLTVSYGITITEENGRPISAEVVAYTLFGIPLAVVVADKDGAYVKNRIGFSE